MNSGEIIWQVPNGDILPLEQLGINDTGSHAPRGSPVITGGGLMFIGTSSDRKLRARDTDTGKILWEANLGAASEGVPAVYEAGGREYIVVPVGGIGLFANAKNQPPAGPNQYVAFALPAGTGGGK
jgi:quinoprotein glucose dehydrogenase